MWKAHSIKSSNAGSLHQQHNVMYMGLNLQIERAYVKQCLVLPYRAYINASNNSLIKYSNDDAWIDVGQYQFW